MQPSNANSNETLLPEILLLFMKELGRRGWKATLARFMQANRECYFLGVPELYRKIDTSKCRINNETTIAFDRDALNSGKFAYVRELTVRAGLVQLSVQPLVEACLPFCVTLYVDDMPDQVLSWIWSNLHRARKLQSLFWGTRLPALPQRISLPSHLTTVTIFFYNTTPEQCRIALEVVSEASCVKDLRLDFGDGDVAFNSLALQMKLVGRLRSVCLYAGALSLFCETAPQHCRLIKRLAISDNAYRQSWQEPGFWQTLSRFSGLHILRVANLNLSLGLADLLHALPATTRTLILDQPVLGSFKDMETAVNDLNSTGLETVGFKRMSMIDRTVWEGLKMAVRWIPESSELDDMFCKMLE